MVKINYGLGKVMYIFKDLRPFQAETLERIKQSTSKYIIISSPTGTGKSFYPAQLVADGYKTLSLVQVKSLQSQYEASYGLSSLTGKSNYACLNADRQSTFLGKGEKITADTCTLPRNQIKARCRDYCPYPLARQDFIESIGGVTNYSKFLLDTKLVSEFEPEYLFLDEAHLLSDVTVDFAGLGFSWASKEFQKYGEPFKSNKPQPIMFNEVRQWLIELEDSLKRNKPLPPHKKGNIRSYLWHKRRLLNVTNTLDFMRIDPASWHIELDNNGMNIRPLTARFHFSGLFDKADKVVLMSATIDYHTLRELGINDYEFISVPNPYPAPLRPIQDLKCPGIGYKSSSSDLRVQAKKIADRLNNCPDNWTGLIHVSSKNMAYDMADRLKLYTDRPFYIPSRDVGTEEVYSEWLNYRDDGTIGLFWQAWEGWDCGKDKINIVAKVPFVDFSGGFDTARFKYDGKAGYSRTAAKMVQGWGRIRRGRLEDYGNGKMVAIADGNWRQLQKYIPKDIMESIS